MNTSESSFEQAPVSSPVIPGNRAAKRVRTLSLRVPFLSQGGLSPPEAVPVTASNPRSTRESIGAKQMQPKLEELFKTEGDVFSAVIGTEGTVDIFLLNGVKLQGKLIAVSEMCLLLKGRETNLQVIFKTAVSTVVPANCPALVRHASSSNNSESAIEST